MDEEKLILLVQQYSFLYDVSESKYNNTIARENAWEDIGHMLDCSAKECKTRWKNLRDSYQKAIKTRRTKSGKAAMKRKPWRFEKEMSFMANFLESGRGLKSNIKEDNLESDNDDCILRNTSIASDSSTPPTASGVLPDYHSPKKIKSKTTDKDDALHKYFAAVEEVVRTFPPHFQIKVKSHISSMIHKMEYEVLSGTSG
ncbi:uncharacterized protein LOC108026062 [Drosophila biarmipes]|uniref:uncharacterized protein LOC108026062 n=1 Tax=Drosophila biarmipes TaxID=125945 RepID=UPI0007E7A6BB|nr:uncharacterized protein LOC108026062 [Drosophila biarmipes]